MKNVLKKSLSCLLALLLVLSAFPIAVQAEETVPPPALTDVAGKLVVLHTNDVHARVNDRLGYAVLKARADEYQKAGAEVLVLDGGDTLHGKPVAVAFQGVSIVNILNRVGTAAMVPGNHDFNYGQEQLQKLKEEMNFPLLAANVTYTDTGKPVFEANTIITKGTYKVGIFGLATPETVTKTNPANVKGLTFADGEAMYQIAQAQVDALKAQGCDYIIALVHLGVDNGSAPNRSTDVLENTTGIDLMVDGHSHTYFPNGEVHGDSLLVSTGTELAHIGEVIYDGKTAKAYSTNENEYEKRDEEITNIISLYEAEVQKLYGVKIGETKVPLNGERAPGLRTEETNLGDLAADGILYGARKAGYDADFALTNGGGIRKSLKVGDITKLDLVEVFPFGNQIVVFPIPGHALLKAIEANTKTTPAAEGGFPQVAGITMKIDTAKKENRVTILEINGKPFDANATYRVATNNVTATGGDKYTEFVTYYNGETTGVNIEDAVIDYIQTELKGVIGEAYQSPQGRTVVIPEDVDSSAWYGDAVYYALRTGRMQGVGNNSFDINGVVTRAQVYQTFYNMEGHPGISADHFQDVAADDWFYAASSWAKQVGMSAGTGTGDFEGTRFITRAELAQTFYNYMKLKGITSPKKDVQQFADAADIPAWAADALSYMLGAGVMQGKDGNRLDPMGNAIRCELAQVHYNFASIDTKTTAEVTQVDKYGNVTLDLTIQDLARAGYELGDILTVTAKGKSMQAPLCSSYSDVDTGNVVVRAPEGGAETQVMLAINMGNFSETYGVKAGDPITLEMKEAGGYLAEYELRQLKRTNDRKDYASDAIFANFRLVALGGITSGLLFRSSSPANNAYGRAAYADVLIQNAGVQTVINLADTPEELKEHFAASDFQSPYYKSLYEKGNVVALGMGVDFTAADFKEKLKTGLEFMLQKEGPYLIHCNEGKDRAGYVIAILEALMGATAEEITADYLLSFENYFHVIPGSEQHKRIGESNIMESLRQIAGLPKGASLAGVDLVKPAEQYLQTVGLSQDQIVLLKTKLMHGNLQTLAA